VVFDTPPPPYSFRVVAFSPTGDNVVTGGANLLVQVWSVKTRRMVYTLPGHKGTVTSVHFTPDGKRVLSSSRDGTLLLWKLGQKEPERRFKGHSGEVLGAALVPQADGGGKFAVSVGRGGEMFLWDLDREEPVKKWALPGTAHWVSCAPDGKHFATGNGNGSVYVFRLTEP
jgi:WD40 repeat protein